MTDRADLDAVDAGGVARMTFLKGATNVPIAAVVKVALLYLLLLPMLLAWLGDV